MNKYPLLEAWEGNAALADLDPGILREIQNILTVEVTGVCCQNTITKFAEFKESMYLEYPDRLGGSTAASLLESIHKHEVSEQLEDVPTQVNVNAGSRTGNSVIIPGEGLVYANQYIVPGIPLTWGEMTKRLDARRIPNSRQLVENIVAFTKVFGIARDKYGKAVAFSSGYRPANLGIGASRSQHILGKAGDSFPLIKNDLKKWYNILKVTPGVMGLGDATNPGQGEFVHFDIRDEKWQVRFDYGRRK